MYPLRKPHDGHFACFAASSNELNASIYRDFGESNCTQFPYLLHPLYTLGVNPPSCSCQLVYSSIMNPMEEKFTRLKKAKPIVTKCPKIQKVAHFLRHREQFAYHYLPKLVSFGPIHHGKAGLKLGEQYKLMWANNYLERTTQVAETLHQKIADNIEELKDLFTEDAIEGFPENKDLSWMLFVDGCSLLEIMDNAFKDSKKIHIKVDLIDLVVQDLFLLENQLPFQVLKLLSSGDGKVLESMNEFLHHYLSQSNSCQNQVIIDVQAQPPVDHILHHLRHAHLDEIDKKDDKTNQKDDITHRNIQDLKTAGIKVTTSNSRKLTSIDFETRWCFSGKLKLPKITVDDTTAPIFLNLIAYEMCPDFENDYGISNFVAFMDSLIDHPSDVKELRYAKILHNDLGSDEEVSDLFNIISKDLVYDMETYSDVTTRIEKHYTKRGNRWITQAYNNHFSTPWAIIGITAALIALVLTFIQTLYSIISP